jgi:choline-sulfatase
MRILYIDIDSLRPDHLGCYGYGRNTSPNIDRIAGNAARFENCYVSDAPCLPSRTALWSGRFGFLTGVVNHGGVAAQPFIEGPDRDFVDLFTETSWMAVLRKLGYLTATVSPFGERHAAWHWYAGFNEVYNTGKRGMELADEIAPVALDWLRRNGQRDNWFLHVNMWDPHTPYRVPLEYGNPFENEPLPDWFTDDMMRQAQNATGMRAAANVNGWGRSRDPELFPRVPPNIDTRECLHQFIDGYDVGVKYADDHIGRIFELLKELKIDDETIIMISADHAENLGELGIWGDHQTADHYTCRIPLIVRWPGLTDLGWVESGLHYHFDWMATMVDLLGGKQPAIWSAQSFAESFRQQQSEGREYLVISQAALTCQRSVRFNVDQHQYLCIQSYHDGYKLYDEFMLFDLTTDPHEQHNLAADQPQVVEQARSLLQQWHTEMMFASRSNVDPMMTVLREGGPFHAKGQLPQYIRYLRDVGRDDLVTRLEERYTDEPQ